MLALLCFLQVLGKALKDLPRDKIIVASKVGVQELPPWRAST